jgi:hypothetical protein
MVRIHVGLNFFFSLALGRVIAMGRRCVLFERENGSRHSRATKIITSTDGRRLRSNRLFAMFARMGLAPPFCPEIDGKLVCM